VAEDAGNGVTAVPVRLPGKAGWACKIIVDGKHVATVADPDDDSRDAALWEARMWAIMYKDTL
jgi:hypothetical protein